MEDIILIITQSQMIEAVLEKYGKERLEALPAGPVGITVAASPIPNLHPQKMQFVFRITPLPSDSQINPDLKINISKGNTSIKSINI